MAETTMAKRRPALAGAMADFPGLSLRAAPLAARHVLRARTPPAQAAGFDLSMAVNRFVDTGGRLAARLGPDEWLLISPEGLAVSGELAGAMGMGFFALAEVSHRQAALMLAGPRAAEALNAGCPLDLDMRAFPVGMATRTILGKIEIALLRLGEEDWRVEVWRSFAPYALEFLRAAAA